VKKKRYAGIFKFLIFWGQKYIACGEKTLKTRDFHHDFHAYFAKNSYFWLNLGQIFEKFNIYGPFWWFKLIFAMEFTFLAEKTHQKSN